MVAAKDHVSLIINRMAIFVALLVAISLPLGYGLTEFEDLSNSLEFKAKVKASALESLIASNPDLWMFAENRMQGLISREPVPLENELVQIFDAQRALVVQSGGERSVPAMSRSYSLFDGDRVVGRIEVSASLLGTIYRTLAAMALGLLLGAMVFLVVGVLPLRALRRATKALIEEKERAQTTLRSISDAVSISNERGCWMQMNPAGLAMIEADALEQVVGQPMLEIIAPEYHAAYADLHKRVIAGETMQLRFEVLGLKGRRRWLETHAVPLMENGETAHLAVTRDITDRKQAEEKIQQLAFHDQLTGLPNRTQLLDRLRQAMTASSRVSSYGALLFIDLDKFKTLNDTLGHDMGDLLLTQVAQRLSTNVRAGDTVARLGGDEFVVMLASLNSDERVAATLAEAVGEKIQAALNQIYQLKDIEYHNTPSIGVTLFNGLLTEPSALLKQADLAMYQAKAAGRNSVRFFDPQMQAVVTARAELENGLREALANDQFVLYYQAQVTGGRQITGVEALVRWNHPQRGMVPPAEFIPLAEETGMILPLGRWVLETACTQLALWATRPEMAHLTVAVNVSSHQFHQRAFVDQVLAVLNHTGANPRRLQLELTESVLISNIEDVVEKMATLKARGVTFSLDDFGTGYSSLSYLKRLPLNQLKIDRSFVRDVLSDPNDAAIAKTIVTLAHSLGLVVMAEGVETQMQQDFLADIGCHDYQGYFFSRPVPIDRFEEFAHQA